MLRPLGGPLVNPCGEVVGMISNQSGKSYAVPVDLIRKIIDHFIKYGRVIRPWLGLRLTFVSEGSRAQIEEENISIHNVIKGFLVVKVIPGSPADRAGFLPGDVVVEIDGKCIGSSKELTDVLWDKVGVPLEVTVKRSTDSSMTLILTVVSEEARPDVSESEQTTDLWLGAVVKSQVIKSIRALSNLCRKFRNTWKLWDVLGLERHASAPVVGVHERYLLGSTRAFTGGYRLHGFDPVTGKDCMYPEDEETGISDLTYLRRVNPETEKVLPRKQKTETVKELPMYPGEEKTASSELVRLLSPDPETGEGQVGRVYSRWEKLAPEVRQTAEIASPAVASLCFMEGGKLFGESSGTVIHPSGLILTCAQVLGSSSKSKEDLAKLEVSVAVDPLRGNRFSNKGHVLYADFHYDIAIIKLSFNRILEAARLGSLYELCPSDSMLYMGSYTLLPCSYPQFYVTRCELISGQTMTFDQGGILEHLLPASLAPTSYIDPLAPTNASGELVRPPGGPLVNPCGEVVGMITNRSGEDYAVPIDLVRKIIDHFIRHGRVIRPWLGLRLTFLSEGSRPQIAEENISTHNVSKGFLVVKVIPGSPADCAGFLPGDVVVEIDGKCIGSSKELTDVLWDKVGVPLEVIVKRSTDSSMTLTLTVVSEEARPDVSESEHTTDLG